MWSLKSVLTANAFILLFALSSFAGVSPREPGQPEETGDGEGAISVRILFEDVDDRLTPADEADLRFEIKNTSVDKHISSIWVEITLQGEMIDQGAVSFKGEESEKRITALRNVKLIPGQVWDFPRHIMVASERNRWIFENIMKSPANDRKPEPEIGITLGAMVKVKIEGVVSPPGEERGNKVTLFEGPVPVLGKNDKVMRLAYPDLSETAGRPLGPDDMQDYYRRGDAYYSHPGNVFIRALAFRAARYEDTMAAIMPTTGTLVDAGDAIDPGPLFPEGPDVRDIVSNIVYFVHACLYPKNADKSVVPSMELAEKIWTGQMRPDRDAEGTFFICQEHSFLLGSMLRALGFSVREVNIMQHVTPFSYQQDAASEVFHNRRWNFWGLFNNEEPFTDHLEHYAGYVISYDMYVGARRSTDYKPRFHMSMKAMNQSRLWQYVGLGNCSGFTQPSDQWATNNMASQWIFGADTKIQWIIEMFSPVAAMVVAEDGRRIGTDSKIDPGYYWQYLFLSREEPGDLVSEMPNARFYPEGLTLYPNASDGSSAIVMPQTIVIPAQGPEDLKSYRIVLTGTGKGPYEIRTYYFDKEGTQTSCSSVKGTTAVGQAIEHSGGEATVAVSTGVKLSKAVDKPAPAEEVAERAWMVSVTTDNEALIALVESRDRVEGNLADLSEDARKAAIPEMLKFLLPARGSGDKKTGDRKEMNAELSSQLEAILKNAVVAEVNRTAKGGVLFKFWVPIGDINFILRRYK